MTRTVRIDAPAKVNLGLEILGRRDDGYHEIRSILAMVDLHDTITATLGQNSTGQLEISPKPEGIDPHDNLVTRSIRAFNLRTGLDLKPNLQLQKRIPVAAGLGGASSDAAATLLAMNALADLPLDHVQLLEVASSLGSDIPFFLGSPAALVSGRGTHLTPVRAPAGPMLIVSPVVDIPAKTSTLYQSLEPTDFSDGSQSLKQAGHLDANATVDPTLLQNAFLRPLRRLAPQVDNVARTMQEAGCPVVALTGAGPSHYSLFPTPDRATSVKQELQQQLDPSTLVLTTFFRQRALAVEG
jgi:4-diphosphocytidyl-2-C-methyl-D-erythritol kinase